MLGRKRLTLVGAQEIMEDVADVADGLCDCGLAAPCNLACIFGSEVEARIAEEPEKLAGTIPLAEGEYIANGKVWYCADKLGGAA